jgi:carbamoyltransferase
VVSPFYSKKLEDLLGPTRDPKTPVSELHQDIAASLQVVTEEIILHLLNGLHRKHPSDNVVVVGGVAMNSVANGKITAQTPFKSAYIPAGAADNGGSFGSAFYVWHRVLGKPRTFELEHGYWGPAPEEPAIVAAVEAEAARVRAEKLGRAALIERTVDALCRGEVVGWFQGRMEFGARALGNRSLIADPRRTDMRDIINLKIKFREKFRPFAPSILEEHVAAYFERDEPAPFMEKVFKIRGEKRAEIPAVTHVDGTGRLQSVSKKTNPLYWELIEAFRKRTGVPILLNTSLNENEPIVHTPAQALSCFLRTKMDVIALGPYFVTRR